MYKCVILSLILQGNTFYPNLSPSLWDHPRCRRSAHLQGKLPQSPMEHTPARCNGDQRNGGSNRWRAPNLWILTFILLKRSNLVTSAKAWPEGPPGYTVKAWCWVGYSYPWLAIPLVMAAITWLKYTQIVSWFLLQYVKMSWNCCNSLKHPSRIEPWSVSKKLRGRTTNQWSNVPSIFGPGVMDGVIDDYPSPKSCSGFTFFGPKERHAKDINKDLKVYSIQIAVVFYKHFETKSIRRSHPKMTLRPMAMAPALRHSVWAGYTCHAPLPSWPTDPGNHESVWWLN